MKTVIPAFLSEREQYGTEPPSATGSPMSCTRPGVRLPNGTILLSKIHLGNEEYVVLALRDGPHPEFATWRADAIANTHWGHYFQNLGDAVKDFEKRAGR